MLIAAQSDRDETRIIPAAVEQEYWNHAVAAFDAKDYELAAMQFRKLGFRSKTLYNAGICYLTLLDDESATTTLEKTLRCDPYFCIAQYQLAFVYHRMGQLDKAIANYQAAIQSMRGNNEIDYTQLGLDKAVYACEIFCNMAAAQMNICDTGAAMRSLVDAHQCRTLPQHDIIDLIMIAPTQKWKLFEPSIDKIFRNRKNHGSLSISSMNLSQIDEIPSSRLLVNIAAGEIDDTIKFMAPIHEEAIRQELDKIQQLEHSRKLSLAVSTITSDKSSDRVEAVSLAKIHLMDSLGIIDQTRMVCLDDCETFERLLARIKKKFDLGALKLKYRDFEGDLITMCDEFDYIAAVQAAINDSSTKPKLHLWCFPIENENQ